MTVEKKEHRNEKLSNFLAQINENIAEQKQDMRRSAYDNLAAQKNKFLLDDAAGKRQLEQHIIYRAEGTMDVIKAMRVYIESDYAQIGGRKFDAQVSFVQSIPVIEAKERTKYHLLYLTQGCNGCAYHEQHDEYKLLKELRDDAENQDRYREELEFNYVYHTIQNRLVKQYLLIFIQNDEAVAACIHDAEDSELIRMHLHLMTNYILDNITFEETHAEDTTE